MCWLAHYDSSELALSDVEHGGLAWSIGGSGGDILAHVCDTLVESLVWFDSAEALAQWAAFILEHGGTGRVFLGSLNNREGLGSVDPGASAKQIMVYK